MDCLCSKDLSVHRKELRFPMAYFGGLDAELPAFETRAHRARKGRPFGLNLEEYLTSGATKTAAGQGRGFYNGERDYVVRPRRGAIEDDDVDVRLAVCCCERGEWS